MAAKIAQLLAKMARVPRGSVDLEPRLIASLDDHPRSIGVARTAQIVFCVMTLARIGGVGTLSALLTASVIVLLLRVYVPRAVRRPADAATIDPVWLWRIPDQGIGLAGSIIGAALCWYLIAFDGDETMRFVAACFMVAMPAGIAARGGGSPRSALAQIVIWLLPLIVATPLVRPVAWTLPILEASYLVALCGIVGRHHQGLRRLIDAQICAERARSDVVAREAELRGIFSNAAAGITEIDLVANRFIRVNRVFCDMMGHSEAELLADFDPTDLTHPDDKEDRARQWAELRQSGRSFEAERRYVRPDGTIIWGRVSVSLISRSANGEVVRVLSIAQDVTDRKNAEAALRSSQDLLRLSLDIGGVGTFRRDYGAGLIYCNRDTRLMNGLPHEDGPIQADTWFATILPEDRPRFVREAAEAHAERREIVTFTYRFMHPERGVRYAETRSRVDYNADGFAISSVGVVIDVTERRRAENRLAHLAHHDPLTDLPNRSLFRLRLDEAFQSARAGEPFAVLCLDLDRFKEVNDTLGHPVGDALLRAVTTRLQGACRASDTVARLGGDEFAIIQAPLKHPADAAAFAKRVIAIVGAPYQIEGHRAVIGTSVGIAVAPDDGPDPDTLLRNADMALYGAKTTGRGRYEIFRPEMDERIRARRTLEIDLREALAGGALEVFYQPLVEVATPRIRGFEALVRWRHPDRGLVMPDQFIPLAESNGLIVPIGAFVLRRACAQAALWPNDTSVAVNLSAFEFGNPEIVDTIASALREAALDPTRLALEITETTMLQDTEATMDTLTRLKALGVAISIDDFGTGFSSLSYLQRFPFDKVKIDRSFIAPLGQTRESLAIVGAIVNLCAALDIETTAEGVETERQFAILSDLGCTEAQGYYFSRPCPVEDLADLFVSIDAAAYRSSRQNERSQFN